MLDKLVFTDIKCLIAVIMKLIILVYLKSPNKLLKMFVQSFHFEKAGKKSHFI